MRKIFYFLEISVIILIIVPLLLAYGFMLCQCYFIENSSDYQKKIEIVREIAKPGKQFKDIKAQLEKHGIATAPLDRYNSDLPYSGSHTKLYSKPVIFSKFQYVTGWNIPMPVTTITYAVYDDGSLKSFFMHQRCSDSMNIPVRMAGIGICIILFLKLFSYLLQVKQKDKPKGSG